MIDDEYTYSYAEACDILYEAITGEDRRPNPPEHEIKSPVFEVSDGMDRAAERADAQKAMLYVNGGIAPFFPPARLDLIVATMNGECDW